ncbi:hypothetical protein [Nevskia soli]|uniref:hypothetical protein n=1 Tax=Nevskia soli TaxID=418856 RepID=UPI0012F879B9|nr:hypothetical protein [Nevskia soli]
MRIHTLPILLGFTLLGAVSHEAANRLNHPGAAAAMPRVQAAPAPEAAMPKQLRAFDPQTRPDAGIAPLSAFVVEHRNRGCASATPQLQGEQQACAWAI